MKKQPRFSSLDSRPSDRGSGGETRWLSLESKELELGGIWADLSGNKFPRSCRPTFCHKLAQVEQVQAPSWYRACVMAQGMARWRYMTCAMAQGEVYFDLSRPNGTGLVQPACLCQWHKHNLCQCACATGTKSHDQF